MKYRRTAGILTAIFLMTAFAPGVLAQEDEDRPTAEQAIYEINQKLDEQSTKIDELQQQHSNMEERLTKEETKSTDYIVEKLVGRTNPLRISLPAILFMLTMVFAMLFFYAKWKGARARARELQENVELEKVKDRLEDMGYPIEYGEDMEVDDDDE